MIRITIILILTLVTLQTPARDKRALVIGIGKQQDKAWTTIHGDRDVKIITSMLRSCGYDDITTLTDEQAVKSAIVNSIKQLTARCSVGDIVYIHFSGHGQRMTDIDGDETADRYDEAWIPYDAYRKYCDEDKGDKHLSDDELHALLTDMRRKVGTQGNIVVVVDACYSGDSTRSPDDTICVRGVTDIFEIPCAGRGNAQPRTEQWLTLSACKYYQVNYEHPNGYGKLSFAIFSLHDDMTTMSNSDIEAAVCKYMQRKDVSPGNMCQTPVLSGDVLNYSFNEIFK